MAFFGNLGKMASETAAKTVQKAQKLSEVSRINSLIGEEEEKINAAYYQIGKLYIQIHAGNGEKDFSGMVSAVLDSEHKISEYRKKIQLIKGVQRCEKCGAEVAIGVAFCSSCGAPMPKTEYASSENTVRCENCGALVKRGMRFCTSCGHPMTIAHASEVTPAELPSEKLCPNCGAKIEDGAAFCTECGHPLMFPAASEAVSAEVSSGKICPNCGAKIEDNAVFCTECGAKIAENVSSYGKRAAEAAEENTSGDSHDESITETEDIPSEDCVKCENCGAMVQRGAAFCTECGHPMSVADAAEVLPAEVTGEKLCPGCGAKIEDGAAFCTNCGLYGRLEDAVLVTPAELPSEKLCPNCGAKIEDGAVFCTECGAKL